MSLKKTVENASAAEPTIYTLYNTTDGDLILHFLEEVISPEQKNNLYIHVDNFKGRVGYITRLMNYPYSDKFGNLVIL